MANEYVLHVKRGESYDVGGFFAIPDTLDLAAATAFARKMARWHADTRVTQAATELGARTKTVDLYDILGIPDAGNIDVAGMWQANRKGPPLLDPETGEYHWGRDWLRFLIGVDAAGQPICIDMKETDQFEGMGPHLLIVGTSGSGKTVFLTTLVAVACLTHSPDNLVVAAFDFKGSALITNIRGFPHVVALQSNLENEKQWIIRMGDVMNGNMDRRQMMLDRAGVKEIDEYEYLRIHRGAKLRPMPHLLWIIDEFAEMFITAPESKEVIERFARQGRSQGLRLIMGSQSLGYQLQHSALDNIAVRVCLRTVGETSSRAVINSDEANHIPKSPKGGGIFRVGLDGPLQRFQTAYPLRAYVPPRQVTPAVVRAEAGYIEPREFRVVGMAATPPTHTAEVVAPEPQAMIDEKTGRVVTKVQASIACMQRLNLPPLEQMWLPPLEALPVDELVRRLRGRAWNEDYGDAGRNVSSLLFPVGLKDQPYRQKQPVYRVDLASANCAVIGKQNSGKTWAIATMISGAALMYTPARIQFYVIALSGTDLDPVARLPHVGGFAREVDKERIGRIIAEMLTLIEEREKEFVRLGLTLESFRERKFGGKPGPVPKDPFGDVFLVIDGWLTFMNRYEMTLVSDVQRIIAKGGDYGVHLIVSSQGWIHSRFPGGMVLGLTANVELKLDKDDESKTNNRAVAAEVPFGEHEHYLLDDAGGDKAEEGGEERAKVIVKIRGRGTSMDGYHLQVGRPELTTGIDVADAIRAQTGAAEAAPVRMLPSEIGIDAVFAQWERGEHRDTVPFGISEMGLVPATIDFSATPHMLFTGRRECGLSNALATVAQAVMRVYSPEQAQIYVIDPHNALLRVVEGAHLGEYAYREDQVRGLGHTLAGLLAGRLPDAESSQEELAQAVRHWSGPELFVIIDREETLASWVTNAFAADGGHPLAGLRPFLSRGREVGLHMVMSRVIDQWAGTFSNPLISEMVKAKTPTVIMDGDRNEGAIVGGIKAEAMPPGRGKYVTDRLTVPVQIALRK